MEQPSLQLASPGRAVKDLAICTQVCILCSSAFMSWQCLGEPGACPSVAWISQLCSNSVALGASRNDTSIVPLMGVRVQSLSHFARV